VNLIRNEVKNSAKSIEIGDINIYENDVKFPKHSKQYIEIVEMAMKRHYQLKVEKLHV
jgi:hypothetical protein